MDALRCERKIWFQGCSLMGDELSIKTMKSKLAKEEALKFIMPNLHMLCVIYVCLLVSTCEAEGSFSILRRIHTYQGNTHTHNIDLITSAYYARIGRRKDSETRRHYK